MTRLFLLLAFVLTLTLTACKSADDPSSKPEPLSVTHESIGHFCSMDLLEHEGPKGQIFVKGRDEPLWFSTIRQTLSYLILPDSPKGLDAVYVTDMAIVTNMRQPEPDSWMDIYDAYFVTESSLPGGMGGEDPLPFSDLEKAQTFVNDFGGVILKFDEITEDYILRYDTFELKHHDN